MHALSHPGGFLFLSGSAPFAAVILHKGGLEQSPVDPSTKPFAQGQLLLKQGLANVIVRRWVGSHAHIRPSVSVQSTNE
jgi:hypothetical protein